MSEIRFEERMSDADALMWTIEQDPLLRSTITSIAVLESPPDRERLRWKIDRATRVIPRLRQRVVSNPLSVAPPRWEVDPNFDLDFHLRWVRAAGDGSMANLFSLAEPLAMQGFDRSRPLWEFAVVEGLEDDGAALVMKIHHAITDGIGGVKLMLETFDAEADPGDVGPMPDAPEIHVMHQGERFVDAWQHTQRRALGLAKRSVGVAAGTAVTTLADPVGSGMQVLEAMQSAGRLLKPAPSPMSPLMTGRSLSQRFHTLSVPLTDTKLAARAAGGKLNDAFVAAVASGFRRYHERHELPASALRMSMPISVRNEATADDAGNQFSPARFPVPLTVRDPVHRMKVVSDLVGRARAEPALQLTQPLAGALNQLPNELTTALFGSMLKGVDFVTSNVPGAPFPVYLAGARIQNQFAFGPMTGAAANITRLSYVDELNVGFNVDPAAIPDSDAFMDDMRAGFEEILKAG